MDEPASVFVSKRVYRHIRRVAIVVDDPRIQDMLAAFLHEMQIETEVWARGIHPLSIENFDPHLILLDVKLGVSDAFTILRSRIPPSYTGVVSIVSGEGIDVVMDAMLLGERLGLRIGTPALKPFSREDIDDLVSAADDLLERRSICEWAYREQAASPAGNDLRLRQALDERLLDVWYQPKFEVATGLVSGAEALIRARASNGEIVLPYVLFRDATKEDMLQLTDFVLAGAVDHSITLAGLGFNKKLSINIPAAYLLQVDPCRIVREATKQPSWPGFIFELTEDEALDDIIDLQIVATQLKLYSVSL